VSAFVNLPLHHKVQKFSSGTGSPRWSWKKVVVVVVCVVVYRVFLAVINCMVRIFIVNIVCCVVQVASSAESCGHSSSSPFPAVDEFVTSVVRSLGNKEAGAIWRWAYFSAGQLLVYDIVHNRWCANVQREHRSNNIMLVVTLPLIGVRSIAMSMSVCLSAPMSQEPHVQTS